MHDATLYNLQDINDEESIRTKKHSPLQQAKPVARDSKEGVKHSNSAPPRLQRVITLSNVCLLVYCVAGVSSIEQLEVHQ